MWGCGHDCELGSETRWGPAVLPCMRLAFSAFPHSLDFILFPPLRLQESGVSAQLLLLLVEAKLARPEASWTPLWSAFNMKAAGRMGEGTGTRAGVGSNTCLPWKHGTRKAVDHDFQQNFNILCCHLIFPGRNHPWEIEKITYAPFPFHKQAE